MRPLHFAARILLFYAGLYPFAIGIVLSIQAGLGAAPWDVFHTAVSRQTNVPLGIVISGVGFVLILTNLLMGIRPTMGTFLNMLSVGPMVQFHMGLVPPPSTTMAAWSMLALGTLLAGVGTAVYTSADLGAGPRDGMMIGLTNRLSQPIAWVKNGIDISLCLIAWLLGGTVGLGTLFVALANGYSVQFGMFLMHRLVRIPGLSVVIKPPVLRGEN